VDGSQQFNQQHSGDSRVADQLAQFYIGDLAA
jgi:hypothetical protein